MAPRPLLLFVSYHGMVFTSEYALISTCTVCTWISGTTDTRDFWPVVCYLPLTLRQPYMHLHTRKRSLHPDKYLIMGGQIAMKGAGVARQASWSATFTCSPDPFYLLIHVFHSCIPPQTTLIPPFPHLWFIFGLSPKRSLTKSQHVLPLQFIKYSKEMTTLILKGDPESSSLWFILWVSFPAHGDLGSNVTDTPIALIRFLWPAIALSHICRVWVLGIWFGYFLMLLFMCTSFNHISKQKYFINISLNKHIERVSFVSY